MPITNSKITILLFALILGSVSLSVSAQSRNRGGDAGSYKLGETDLFPSVRIDYLQNSNAFLQPNDEISATDITISPELTWVADRRLLRLEGSYKGEYNVSSEDELNYNDHRIAIDAAAELTSKKRVTGNLSLDFGHEELGTSLTRLTDTQGSDSVKFADLKAQGAYRYGSNGAKGNLSAGLLIQNLGYTSRNDLTSGLGYTRFEPFAEFSLRLSGDTRVLTQIRYASFQFENSGRDRNDLSLLAGMQFATTGKSGGSALLGVVQSQPSLSGASDQTEFVASASLFWEPTSFSRLELFGTRQLDNTGSSFTNVNSITAVEDLVRLTWLHSWSSRVSHKAVVQSRSFTRTCPALDESTTGGSLELNVQVRRWLSVGVSGSGSTRDISGCPVVAIENQSLNYDKTTFGAHIRATL